MIYLDNASTSWPKPPAVAEAMSRYLEELGASPGRGGYGPAVEAERLVENTRRELAKLFDVDDANRVVLCFNCTDALNMAIKGVLAEGDHVITTMFEHNSVSRPLRRMADVGFVEVSCVAPGGDGIIDPQAIARAMKPQTRLVVCTHASNVLGTIQPVAEIGALVRQHEALFLVDAAQSAGVLPISAEAMGIDLLAFSGHKALLGPPGTGG
ncbi:MAG: aminotransferase class V-fold PLP-dependent enzyme, partial [Phycisphaerae bacterium]